MTNQNSESPRVIECGAASVLGTLSYRLESAAVGQKFTVDIASPSVPSLDDRPLPVLFVLDGDYWFATVTQIARNLQMDRHGTSAFYVVGIGYRDESGTRPPLGLRTRDLTPSDDARYVAMMRAAPAPFTLPDHIQPGGSARFLSFLTDELLPFLTARFPIDGSDLAIAGSSLGGLFALHALFTAPETFSRYIAVSPAIWWDGGLLLREEAALAERCQDLAAQVFLSAGALEEEVEPSARMLSNLDRLVEQVQSRSYASLKLERQIFPDEGHLSVFPTAVSRGMRAVFDRNAVTADWAKLPPR